MKNLKRLIIYGGMGQIMLIILLIFYLIYYNFFGTDFKKILNSNIESVDCTKHMTKSLFSIFNIHSNYFFNPDYKFDEKEYDNALQYFQRNMEEEDHNITEYGEKEFTQELHNKYKMYISLFDSVYKQKNHSHIIYFSKFMRLQNELIELENNIYTTNYFGIISRNHKLILSSTKIIFSIFIFFELILLFTLYQYSKSMNKKSYKKDGSTRDTGDYPKYF